LFRRIFHEHLKTGVRRQGGQRVGLAATCPRRKARWRYQSLLALRRP
jgi:hypothetical protein